MFPHFADVRIFLGSGRKGEPAKDRWAPYRGLTPPVDLGRSTVPENLAHP
jgi:hypothetical protein